ncbi:MAG TPA: hypothetical protein VHP58_05065 [Alphaproteobacteria bacterium]|nr:hypothetical protein [Alphaproteobacteria bacterium]
MDDHYSVLTVYVVINTNEPVRLTQENCVDIILDAAKAALKSMGFGENIIAEVNEPSEYYCKLGVEIHENVPVTRMISLTNHIASAAGSTIRKLGYDIGEITPKFEVITNLNGSEARPPWLELVN